MTDPETKWGTLKKCPKCGHPGGLIYCEVCFGPRKPVVRRVGFESCWQEGPLGRRCRRPKGHDGAHIYTPVRSNEEEVE